MEDTVVGSYSVAMLRKQLLEKGLPIEGTRQELIRRLTDHNRRNPPKIETKGGYENYRRRLRVEDRH